MYGRGLPCENKAFYSPETQHGHRVRRTLPASRSTAFILLYKSFHRGRIPQKLFRGIFAAMFSKGKEQNFVNSKEIVTSVKINYAIVKPSGFRKTMTNLHSPRCWPWSCFRHYFHHRPQVSVSPIHLAETTAG